MSEIKNEISDKPEVDLYGNVEKVIEEEKVKKEIEKEKELKEEENNEKDELENNDIEENEINEEDEIEEVDMNNNEEMFNQIYSEFEKLQFYTDRVRFNSALFRGIEIILKKLTKIEEMLNENKKS